MSSKQSHLGDHGTKAETTQRSTKLTGFNTHETKDGQPKLGFGRHPSGSSIPDITADARDTDWIIFTGRYPYVFDAARFGFGIGHREDSSYQWQPHEVDLPIHFLDNEYKDPDLDRFVNHVFEYEPEIAVIGDLYNPTELREHIEAANEIWGSYPDTELIIVPKHEDLLNIVPTDFILGYPNGNSPIQADDIASYKEWRELPHRLHILGGTPLSTYEEIKHLTEEWVTGEPPADITGLDWNGYQRYAENHGDYLNANGGWNRDLREQYVPKRDLIRYSLLNAKHFWVSHGVWPGRGIDELPDRGELLSANDVGGTPLDATRDELTLLTSPSPKLNRCEQPIFRTDETQAEILEPLSPLAGLIGDTKWEPEGDLNKPVEFTSPQAHYLDPICAGCGRNIYQDETLPHSQEAIVISYEKHTTTHNHHYESTPQDGPKTLKSNTRFPALAVYCSDSCRKHTEWQNPHNLLQSTNPITDTVPATNMGEEIGRITLQTNEL